MPDPIQFLDAIAGYAQAGSNASSDRPIKLARIDPAYNRLTGYPGPPPTARVTFEGESTLSGKYYAIANGYIPSPGERCWMVPVGTTYLITGAVNPQTSQGFWQDADGTDSGVEFGDGAFYDTTDGLYINNDATITGALLVGGKRIPTSSGLEMHGTMGVISTTSATFVYLSAPAILVGHVKQGSSSETKIKFSLDVGCRRGGTDAITTVRFGVNVDYAGTPNECCGGELRTIGVHQNFTGFGYMTGLAAGSHDYGILVRRSGGTGTIITDATDFYSFMIEEVPA